jgi:hypothetical protein
MNADAMSFVDQLIEQIGLFRDRLSAKSLVKTSVVTSQCNLILDDLAYLKPRAVISALSLPDPAIHDLAIAILVEMLRSPDYLKRSILIHLLMDIPAERYQPQLANLLQKQPPAFIPEESPNRNASQRALSILTARQFLRGLLIEEIAVP